MPESDGVGAKFAAAIAAKDRTALLALLDDSVEFRALTPGRNWSADEAATAADEIIFGSWFTDADRGAGVGRHRPRAPSCDVLKERRKSLRRRVDHSPRWQRASPW